MIFIGIAGGSGSGKTTIAQSIQEKLGRENVEIFHPIPGLLTPFS